MLKYEGVADRSILVVDDDAAELEGFARILEREGFEVRRSTDPVAALEIASTFVPDAIVVDLRMPEFDGIAFLQSLRDRRALASVPAAIVTGDYLIDDGLIASARALRADVLLKPIWADELVAIVRRLVGRRTRTTARGRIDEAD